MEYRSIHFVSHMSLKDAETVGAKEINITQDDREKRSQNLPHTLTCNKSSLCLLTKCRLDTQQANFERAGSSAPLWRPGVVPRIFLLPHFVEDLAFAHCSAPFVLVTRYQILKNLAHCFLEDTYCHLRKQMYKVASKIITLFVLCLYFIGIIL